MSVKHVLALSAFLLAASTASANIVYLVGDWVDAAGSGVSAHGVITIDEALLPNPGMYQSTTTLPPFLLDVTLTVTHAAQGGNGTFTLADFSGFSWNTGEGTLDFSKQLIGQPTPEGLWGSLRGGGNDVGDFNFFSQSLAPTGFLPFEMYAGGRTSIDALVLTSLLPVPEPSSAPLLLIVLAGGALVVVRRRQRA